MKSLVTYAALVIAVISMIIVCIIYGIYFTKDSGSKTPEFYHTQQSNNGTLTWFRTGDSVTFQWDNIYIPSFTTITGVLPEYIPKKKSRCYVTGELSGTTGVAFITLENDTVLIALPEGQELVLAGSFTYAGMALA